MRLTAILLSLCLGLPFGGMAAAQSDFKVTLLGSGVPIPDPDRFGPATLVEAGG
jgi:ribonuclease Z